MPGTYAADVSKVRSCAITRAPNDRNDQNDRNDRLDEPLPSTWYRRASTRFRPGIVVRKTSSSRLIRNITVTRERCGGNTPCYYVRPLSRPSKSWSRRSVVFRTVNSFRAVARWRTEMITSRVRVTCIRDNFHPTRNISARRVTASNSLHYYHYDHYYYYYYYFVLPPSSNYARLGVYKKLFLFFILPEPTPVHRTTRIIRLRTAKSVYTTTIALFRYTGSCTGNAYVFCQH